MNTFARRGRPRRRLRRGFNLVELLIALAISAALLTATMVALDASFMAYQATTEVASTHTVGRLAMNRLLTLIRTGQEFGPFPLNPQDSTVESDYIEFLTPQGQVLTVTWFETKPSPTLEDNALYLQVDNGPQYLLLGGVVAQYDPPTSTDEDDRIKPFTLEYELGRTLYRATINLTIVPDDNVSIEMEGDNADMLHLVASAMPRMVAY